MEQLRIDGWADNILGMGTGPDDAFIIYPTFQLPGYLIVYIRDYIVSHIIAGFLTFDYTVGELIEQFGPPEGIHQSGSGRGCFSCEEWESSDVGRFFVFVQVLYPSQGLWFTASVPSSGSGCVCPEMTIRDFCYYAPISMEQALADNYLVDLCWPHASRMSGLSEETLIDWHGFGGEY